jgi:murein DD-endopeptidase MepM/ murein hydrolase activator NlpD
MVRPSRKNYFTLRGRLTSHSQRLGLLLAGTLIGLMLVSGALRRPPERRVIFQPSDPVSQADQQRAEAPPPTLPALAPVGGGAPAEQAPAFPIPESTAPIFDDVRFTSEPNLTVPAVQALLDAQPGPLKSALLPVGDRTMSVAEVVVGQAYLYSLNPKAILAILELQQGLLSNAAPSPDQIDWAAKFHGEEEKWRGLYGQIRWTARELRRAMRDYGAASELQFKDEDSKGPIPPGLNAASYAVVRVLAATMTPEEFDRTFSDGAFVATYSRLFEDPRQTLGPLPPPAAPFLQRPMESVTYVTSFFDHEFPFLTQNGSLVSWWGRRESEISYDGHDGWDYGLRPPEPILAAAAGTVVWAANSDDGCGVPARGVVIDHGNGYRTLYWHLSEIGVELGQTVQAGDKLGIVGATGCAIGSHLHFQTQYLGRNTDPYGWCSSDTDPWSQHPAGTSSRWLWADRPNPCELPNPDLVVTQRSPGFSRTGDGWETAPVGVSQESLWIPSQLAPITSTSGMTQTISELAGLAEPVPTFDPANPPPPPPSATWRAPLSQPGRYRVLAYIPYFYNGHEDATAVHYTIFHAEGQSDVIVNQFVFANEWVDLGTYTFDPAGDPRVEVTNVTLQSNQGVWVGALYWEPAP